MLKKRHNSFKVFIAMLAVLICILAILFAINQRVEIGQISLIFIPTVSAILMTWLAFSLTVGREATVYIQPSNYPPDGINSMKAGCIIDGELNNRGLISGIYYMATRGYLQIVEYDVHQFSFKNLVFPKDEDESIQMFYKAIFGEVKIGGIVTLVEAKERLIKAIPTIETSVKKSITKNKNRDIADMTGKVLGFKQSLVETKGEVLKIITCKDSNYLYNILPYAYTFAITSKVSSNFGPIKVEMPNWYQGYNVTEDYIFDVIFYNAMLKYLPEQFKNVVIEELNFRIKTGIS